MLQEMAFASAIKNTRLMKLALKAGTLITGPSIKYQVGIQICFNLPKVQLLLGLKRNKVTLRFLWIQVLLVTKKPISSISYPEAGYLAV